ncbi:MAG: carboxymuconolactone decarboxylase family protein [Leptospirillum sp.]|jgi:4-carboxymuconolactone decarboxylase
MIEADVRNRYRDLLGFVPENIEKRFTLARLSGKMDSIGAIERFREELIHDNPLDRKTQQLVHLAMLLAQGNRDAAILHVRGALKAGATPAELYGVCETGAIVGGMPVYSLAVDLVHEVLREQGFLPQSNL